MMDNPDAPDSSTERRTSLRQYLPFPIVARGRDSKGIKFECAAILHDISAGGARVRLTHPVEEGATLKISFRASSNPKDSSSGPLVSASGKVLRVTPQPLGTCDVAVQFKRPLEIG